MSSLLLIMTSAISYFLIAMILFLCGYSEKNQLGYIYASIVVIMFIYGEVIFDSQIPLLIASFLLFVYIFGMILTDPKPSEQKDQSAENTQLPQSN